MVATAAREIADGELVFVGMRLPMLAFLVAKRTHAPRAVGLYENGLIRETPSPQLLYTMADPPNLRGATQCGQMLDVMAFLAAGPRATRISGRGGSGSLRKSEFDVGRSRRRKAAACRDPAARATLHASRRRTVVLLAHERTRFRERVGHITSPGHGRGNGWRTAQGLPARSGPSALITTLGVLRFGRMERHFCRRRIRVWEWRMCWPIRDGHCALRTNWKRPRRLRLMSWR